MRPPRAHETDAQYRLPLVVEPSDLEPVRHIVRAHLQLWGIAVLADDASVIVTELLTNVHRHAGGNAVLLLQRSGGVLQIKVSDRSERLPAVTEPDWVSQSGRGIFLVDELADRWGIDRQCWGKIVWAELRAELSPL
jgi:anti-sigma regulatory factor (Ser/Thr protein kinase)